LFTHITNDGLSYFVHSGEDSSSTTRSFTHGTITITDSSIQFAQTDPIPFTAKIPLREGDSIFFGLVDSKGVVKKQVREGMLSQYKDKVVKLKSGEERVTPHPKSGHFYIRGMAQTPKAFTAEDGWAITVCKMRAYMTHPGIETDANAKWLQGVVARQRELWNRLAYAARSARRACSTSDPEEVRRFVSETVKPALDAFNVSMGREQTKLKIKYPDAICVCADDCTRKHRHAKELTVGSLFSVVKVIDTRIAKDQPYPLNLKEDINAFSDKFKTDYSPHQAFTRNLRDHVDNVIDELNALMLERQAKIDEDKAAGNEVVEQDCSPFRHWEIDPIVAQFEAAMRRRAKNIQKNTFAKGWPAIKYSDSKDFHNWCLHWRASAAGLNADNVFGGKGALGLQLGPKLPPHRTGHLNMGVEGSRTLDRRSLRQGTITIPNKGGAFSFRFGVLQHQELPENAHIKGWKFVHKDGDYFLCLVLEVKRPKLYPTEQVAGIDINWRKIGDTLRIATVFDPETRSAQHIFLDLNQVAPATGNRVPFVVPMGANRQTRRNAEWNRRKREAIDTSAYGPDRYVASDFQSLREVQKLRDAKKDEVKRQLEVLLGDDKPAWLVKAGLTGIKKIGAESSNLEVKALVDTWQTEDTELGRRYTHAWGTLSARLKKGYEYVAVDICTWLTQREYPVHKIAVEDKFLKKWAEKKDNDEDEAVKASRRLRQWASLGTFMTCLKNAAARFGIEIVEVDAKNTTRQCSTCGKLNEHATSDIEYHCVACFEKMDVDFNAAKNIASAVNPLQVAELVEA
jgi:hypothetical protein